MKGITRNLTHLLSYETVEEIIRGARVGRRIGGRGSRRGDREGSSGFLGLWGVDERRERFDGAVHGGGHECLINAAMWKYLGNKLSLMRGI